MTDDIKVIIEGDIVLIFDYDELDPDGAPTITEMSLEQYQELDNEQITTIDY
jgi:hypothetical protein